MGRKTISATITRDASGRAAVAIAGDINEYASGTLTDTFRALNGEVDVNLRALASINSTGVGSLSSVLRGFGGRVTYMEVPPSFLQALNMVPSLLVNARVGSVLVPFTCEECHKAWLMETSPKTLSEARAACREVKCAGCGRKAELDAEFEDYFAYLAT